MWHLESSTSYIPKWSAVDPKCFSGSRTRNLSCSLVARSQDRHGCHSRGLFCGLMFADYAPRWNLVPRVGSITSFLAPFFFFEIGSRFNARALTGNLFTMAVVISLLAVISKLIGCGLPLLREGWPMVFRVGIGMMPRGEVALIVALVGLQSRMLSQSAYGIIVLMTVVTTILAPPILRYLFRSKTTRQPHSNVAARFNSSLPSAGELVDWQ